MADRVKFSLACAGFMLVGAVAFFKLFDSVGKWGDRLGDGRLFMLIVASGLLITASGALMLLALEN